MITLEELIMEATYIHSSTSWRIGDVFYQESTDRVWFCIPHINGGVSNLVFRITADFARHSGLGNNRFSIEDNLSSLISELKINSKLEDIIRIKIYL